MKMDKDINRCLGSEIYERTAVELAPLLLGKLLCRRQKDGTVVKLPITETEAYFTEADTACHAHKGRTKRTDILYSKGGVAYIYLCYGIHEMLNVVSGRAEVPQAVLIRGVAQFSGPGKLTKALQIDRSLNGEDLIRSEKLWIEDNGDVGRYYTGKRIGIDYAAAEDREKLWRFYL